MNWTPERLLELGRTASLQQAAEAMILTIAARRQCPNMTLAKDKRMQKALASRDGQTSAWLAAAARLRSQLMLAKSSTANTISIVATASMEGSIESRMPLHICRGTVR